VAADRLWKLLFVYTCIYMCVCVFACIYSFTPLPFRLFSHVVCAMCACMCINKRKRANETMQKERSKIDSTVAEY
jgi:hypothetical protein